MSGSLDARVKSWDPWTASATGTAKCAAPVAGMAPAVASPLLQPHTLFVSGGCGVQLLDARCMRVVGGVALAQPAELRCFAQWGWDLAVGGSDGARVFDLRVLSSSAADASGAPGTASAAAGGGSSSTAGRGLPERLRVGEGPSRPVSRELGRAQLLPHALATFLAHCASAGLQAPQHMIKWCSRALAAHWQQLTVLTRLPTLPFLPAACLPVFLSSCPPAL